MKPPARDTTRPHAFQVAPYGYYCHCGAGRAHRRHQPLWWRALHPLATWR